MGRIVLLVALAAALLGVGAPAAAAADSWCGTGETPLNRTPDVVAGPLVHMVYAYPSDGADQFAQVATQMVNDVEAVENWWVGQDPTREPRFDLAAFPGCSGIPSLDISVVKLTSSSADLRPSSTRFDTLAREVPTFGRWMKVVVYYAGPLDDPSLCGTGGGSPDRGDDSLAVVYTASDCSNPPSGQAAVLAHELVHELGAPDGHQPHPCPNDTGHVCDSDHDLMYPSLSYDSLDQLVLDVGHDDYYRHGGSWFDLATSAWLRHLDQPQQPLALTIAGSGDVTSDVPGVTCSSSCTTQWDAGTSVVLEAEPGDGARFVGWKGGCSSDPCALTLSAPAAVTAVFGPARVRLTVRVAGRGSVAGSSLTCPPRCGATVEAGQPLTLRATPAKGWRFAGWTAGCRGTRPVCALTPQASLAVAARFARVARR